MAKENLNREKLNTLKFQFKRNEEKRFHGFQAGNEYFPTIFSFWYKVAAFVKISNIFKS